MSWRISIKDLVLVLLMVGTAVSSQALRPTQLLADTLPELSLERLVPISFGGWRLDPMAGAQVVNPEQKAMLEKIYSQTLTRTYVNSNGYRIMLSIAYGKNQSKEGQSQLHKPEVCYPAQGFRVLSRSSGILRTGDSTIETTRLETRLSQRVEPLTYWTVVGDQTVQTGWDTRLVELGYATKNLIPDGMLVRVSSIDELSPKAYHMQEEFAAAMINAIDPAARARFAGAKAASAGYAAVQR